MTAPNMAAITASLARSLQNCSLNHTTPADIGFSSTSDAPDTFTVSDDPTLELNSNVSLPFHWEQCLDLKTGEIYYINWSTGMRAKEDPRTSTAEAEYSGGGDYYSDEDEDGNSSYDDTEQSSSDSSPAAAAGERVGNDHVLVVGGCKSCLMYFMVPKQVRDCPKCAGQLLHFDRSDTASDP